MKRILLLSLAFIAGLFIYLEPCFAEEKVLQSLTLQNSFCFRHNASGFWYAVENSGSACIYDESILSGDPVCSGSVLLTYALPKNIAAALKAGLPLKARIECGNSCSSIDPSFFNYRFTGPGTMEMELRLSPKISGYTLNDFLQGLIAPVPLIDNAYGRNIYIVYPLIGSPGRAPGFFSQGDPYLKSASLFHPSIVKDDGKLKAGETIIVDGQEKSAFLYTLGKKGSLNIEEAVLLEFYCPFKLIFYFSAEDLDENESDIPWTSFIEDQVPEQEPTEPLLKLHRVR